MSNWTKRISQITPLAPTSLDDVLAPLDPRYGKEGSYSFPQDAITPELATPLKSEELVAIGVRVTEDTPNRVALAMKLAQMAAEKEAEPIVLSHVDATGLERFGFRIERIAGATEAERAAAEAQVIKFWNIVLVI